MSSFTSKVLMELFAHGIFYKINFVKCSSYNHDGIVVFLLVKVSNAHCSVITQGSFFDWNTYPGWLG